MCDMCEYSIDNSWIEEFDELDKEYAQYYTEDLLYIHLRCVYINSLNEIEQIKEAPVQLISPNHISRDELIGILKRNMQLSHKKYTVLSMLKYNIDIEPQNIKHLVVDVDNSSDIGQYLSQVSNIDSITFNKSIPIFHPLNELIILFYEKLAGTGAGTGTVIETSRQSSQTKKIYIRSAGTTSNKNKTRCGSSRGGSSRGGSSRGGSSRGGLY